MKLIHYFTREGRGAASRLCAAIGAHASDMSDWAAGKRVAPAKACVLIEQATAGAVSRQDLHPEDFWLIWPELPRPTPGATGPLGAALPGETTGPAPRPAPRPAPAPAPRPAPPPPTPPPPPPPPAPRPARPAVHRLRGAPLSLPAR